MFFQQALINMGIFDRKSITKTIKTTEGFYFGKSESEGGLYSGVKSYS